MNKYYVTCGDHEFMVLAVTPLQACLFMFYRHFKLEDYIETIGSIFRVSERGYESHDDDKCWETSVIVGLAVLNNERRDKEVECDL